MSVIRRLRSFLVGPRRGLGGALTLMVVVLTVVSAHALCGVHLDEQQAGGGQVLVAYDAPDFVAAELELLGATPQQCSEHGGVVVRCDPPLSLAPALVPAVLPEPSVRRHAPGAVYRDHRNASRVATAVAPSLHALGISRT